MIFNTYIIVIFRYLNVIILLSFFWTFCLFMHCFGLFWVRLVNDTMVSFIIARDLMYYLYTSKIFSLSFLEYMSFECKYLVLNMLLGWLFGVLRHTREFFTHMETSPLPLKGFILTYTYIRYKRVLLYSELMAIDQWRFFSVTDLMCHRAFFYIGLLWESVTLTQTPNVWQWSCHYLFLRLKSVAAGIQTPNLPSSFYF